MMLPLVVAPTNALSVPPVVFPVKLATVGADFVVEAVSVPLDVLPFFQVALAVPLDALPPLARLWHDAFFRCSTDLVVALPPVAAVGLQPDSVPFDVIVALCAVVVSGGEIVAVPLLRLHVCKVVTASAGAFAMTRTAGAASVKAKAN